MLDMKWLLRWAVIPLESLLVRLESDMGVAAIPSGMVAHSLWK